MSQIQVDIPAGSDHMLTRRIVAAPPDQTTDPFTIIDQLTGT